MSERTQSKFSFLALFVGRYSVAHALLQGEVLRAPFASLSDTPAHIAVELLEVFELCFSRFQVLTEGRCATAWNARGF